MADRNQVVCMARLAAEVGLRLRELCWLAIDDLHFSEAVRRPMYVWARGSRMLSPRVERLVQMLFGGSSVVVSVNRGGARRVSRRDWTMPRAPLFPSERDGPVSGSSFAKSLKEACKQHLRGPVSRLTPPVLRHAAASRLYGDGVGTSRDPAAAWASVAVYNGSVREPSGIASDGRVSAGRLLSGVRQWWRGSGPTRRSTCVACIARPLVHDPCS